jgi:sensor c-di-GMP phosphodiesterase-like protein
MKMVNAPTDANRSDSRRRLAVIILSCVLVLLVGWSAADAYFATRQQQVNLRRQIQNAKRVSQSTEQLQQTLETKTQQLAEARARGVSTADVHEFRRQLVEMTRTSGCRVRRINNSKPRIQDWQFDDNPLAPHMRADKKNPSQYRLVSQQLDLTIDGKLPAVRDLLDRLAKFNKLIHTDVFTLRPTTVGSNDVTVQLRLMLFDLEDKPTDGKTEAV